MAIALAIHALLGGDVLVSAAMDHIPLAILNFGLVLVVGGPLGEEFGWRGYAMPALTDRWGWRAASLVIGIVWGLWHLPLFFMVGTAQSAMSMPLFMVNIVAGSVIFGWLFVRTRGSVLPALVLHTSLNAWAGILGIVPNAATGRPYALVTGVLLLFAMVLLICKDTEPSEAMLTSANRTFP
ncbi:MAG: CPBP family glutamic-type intramembrane protease [Beijerinckiaceae bacterium]